MIASGNKSVNCDDGRDLFDIGASMFPCSSASEFCDVSAVKDIIFKPENE